MSVKHMNGRANDSCIPDPLPYFVWVHASLPSPNHTQRNLKGWQNQTRYFGGNFIESYTWWQNDLITQISTSRIH